MFIRIDSILAALRFTPCALLFLVVAPVSAGVHDEVGFSRLQAEVGAALPTGKTVAVAQVESSLNVTDKSRAGTDKIRTWMPDVSSRHFTPGIIVDKSGAPVGVHSGHATGVARRIIGRGRNQGMVSEVAAYEVFSVGHWLSAGMMRVRTGLAPDAGAIRVINHSWASGSNNSEVLRRGDWLTDRDEVIQVVGVRNAVGKVNLSLMAALANAIVVGRSDGGHSVGTVEIDKNYPGGRTRPHLVAPLKTGSAAAPTVASAVILLLDTAADPSLSTRQDSFDNRGGQAIYDAGRSEVIRAVLMAAADRETNNATVKINGYRDTPEHRSDNGLDIRYGAGQLNVHRAWMIIAAGEQDEGAQLCGFDYEPGLAGRGDTRRYNLPEVTAETQLAATVSWNLIFPNKDATRFDASAVLNDLDLGLYEVIGETARRVQASAGRGDTTETILAGLEAGKRYYLQVNRVDTNAMDQDYAIAWYVGSDTSDR